MSSLVTAALVLPGLLLGVEDPLCTLVVEEGASGRTERERENKCSEVAGYGSLYVPEAWAADELETVVGGRMGWSLRL